MPASRLENGAGFAMAGALLLVGVHVAGKAVRDTLFLSNFAVTDLPKMMIAGSAVSLLAAIAVSRFLAQANPARTVPPLVAFSSVLFFGEWLLVEASPRVGAIAVYLHLTSISLVLFSGFWSVVNERFDPYSAKTIVPRVSGFGALGGVLGGGVAARVAPVVGIEELITGFAAFHLVAAGVIFGLSRPMVDGLRPADEEEADEEAASGRFTSALILRMALLIAAVEGTEKLIDYAFKAAAADAYPDEADLVRFFALFYTVSNVTAFGLQTSVGPRVLKVLGVGGTLALVPALVGATSAGAAFVHRLATSTLARGATSVLGTSLFKASFELLWTPVPPEAKRRAKVFVDVGASGVGELLGSGLVLVLVIVMVGASSSVLLGLAALFSVGSLGLVVQLHRGYVAQLAANLRDGVLPTRDDRTSASRSSDTLVGSRVTIDRAELIARLHEIELAREAAGGRDAADPAPVLPMRDPIAPVVAELESADPQRMRAALSTHTGRAELAPHVIDLLGRPAVADEALTFLRALGDRITGQLVDVLLDDDREALVRRRIPSVLETIPGERAFRGLAIGCLEPDFEVVIESTRSALRVVEAGRGEVDRDDVFALIERCLAVDDRTWDQRGRRRGEMRDLSALLEARELTAYDRNLELIFTALAGLFGRDVMASTLRALYFGDPAVRGTALEYLQTILPDRLRKPLFARIPGGDTARVVRRRGTELAEILRGAPPPVSRSSPGEPDGGVED